MFLLRDAIIFQNKKKYKGYCLIEDGVFFMGVSPLEETLRNLTRVKAMVRKEIDNEIKNILFYLKLD